MTQAANLIALRLLRGHASAAGLWLPPNCSDPVARMAALWQPGSRILLCDNGFLLLWPHAMRLDVALSPALAVVARNGGLVACDVAGLAGRVALPRAGAVVHFALAELRDVDPGDWLDLSDWQLADVLPLGPPPAAIAPAPQLDLRAERGMAPPSGQAIQLFRTLHAPQAESLGLFPRIMARLGQRMLARAQARSAQGGSHARARAPLALARLWDSLTAPLWRWTAGLAWGKHLQRLLEAFDDGDLDTALRRAIPLSNQGDSGDGPPAWRLPEARRELTLQLQRGQAQRSSIALADQLFADLRRSYTAAFERLLRLGRLHDAVFVLVELLGEPLRAAELLEKHGELHLAAQVAESSPASLRVAVRIWLRLGNHERAIALANRCGAFAWVDEALAGETALRATFRRAWLEFCVDQGDFAQAAQVVVCEPSLLPLLIAHAETAWQSPTPALAQVLARGYDGTPTAHAALHERLQPWLQAQGVQALRMRSAFALGLAQNRHRAQLARPLLRALLADAHAWPGMVPQAQVRDLAIGLGDRTLAADLPSFAVHRRGRWPTVQLAAADCGTQAIEDVVLGDDGSVALAMGEAGVRILDRDGVLRARIDEPVNHWVRIEHAGGLSQQVIGIVRRPWGVRVCRVDLRRGSATPWIEGEFSTWSSVARHGNWFVAEREAICALDLSHPQGARTWRVGALGGAVRYLHASASGVAAVVALQGSPADELWLYSPALTLTRRIQLRPAAGYLTLGQAHGEAVYMRPDCAAGRAIECAGAAQSGGFGVTLPESVAADAPIDAILGVAGQLAVVVRGSAGCEVAVWRKVGAFDQAAATLPDLHIALTGAQAAVASFAAEAICVADNLGRLLVFDLASGSCVRDARVR